MEFLSHRLFNLPHHQLYVVLRTAGQTTQHLQQPLVRTVLLRACLQQPVLILQVLHQKSGVLDVLGTGMRVHLQQPAHHLVHAFLLGTIVKERSLLCVHLRWLRRIICVFWAVVITRCRCLRFLFTLWCLFHWSFSKGGSGTGRQRRRSSGAGGWERAKSLSWRTAWRRNRSWRNGSVPEMGTQKLLWEEDVLQDAASEIVCGRFLRNNFTWTACCCILLCSDAFSVGVPILPTFQQDGQWSLQQLSLLLLKCCRWKRQPVI